MNLLNNTDTIILIFTKIRGYGYRLASPQVRGSNPLSSTKNDKPQGQKPCGFFMPYEIGHLTKEIRE
jgi:hypothetical protein